MERQLRVAAYEGDLLKVRSLGKQGCPANAQNKAGFTPLLCAVEKGHSDMVQHLLENGSSVKERVMIFTMEKCQLLQKRRATEGLFKQQELRVYYRNSIQEGRTRAGLILRMTKNGK